jgi:murein DD-endopeptidase / murein LD-carboxypeptidase
MTTRSRFFRPLAVIGLTVTIAWTGLGFINTPTAAAATEESAFTVSASRADSVIALGNRYLGTPYKFGSKTGVTSTFDCSSFTQLMYSKIGISLPRTSKDQATKGAYVSKSNLRKGDLVFFSTRSSNGRIAHVAIYAGNGKILHTYGEGGVKYSNLNSGWWSSHYITARRVIR